MPNALFQNRKLIIATKHKKEMVIAPILEKSLGVICFTDNNLDTDTLGTFTGEIERENDPIVTARKKCLWAMELNNCDLGVASEGSFGPHPSSFFVNADDEFLIFIDKKNDLEIIVRELSLETNFNGADIKSEQELLDFAFMIHFPSHALILRKSKSDNTSIVKGITDWTHLKNEFYTLNSKYDRVHVETDMRAMFNPLRMSVIETATKKLIDAINSCCPNCDIPGFVVSDVKKGLKCSLCGFPTKSPLSLLYKCQKCSFEKEEMYPNNKTKEDPMYCDNCNP